MISDLKMEKSLIGFLISVLANPTSEQNDYNETDEVDVLVMFYGQSQTFIEGDQLRAFR